MEIIHTPVLLEETLSLLAPEAADEWMVDATVGEGGHSFAFLSRFPGLRVTGIDVDREILAVARERLAVFAGRVRFHAGWSGDFFAETRNEAGEKPGRILIDLGISSFHYEKGRRGFSFRRDEELDMRLDPRYGESAGSLLRRLSERDLADLLYRYGGERFSRRIARLVAGERRRAPVFSSVSFAELVSRAVPPAFRRGPIHPATRSFQALRIAVNGELEKLPALLEDALAALKPGGRLGVISFHSGEDRVVKNCFREKSRDSRRAAETPIKEKGEAAFRLVTPKPVVPGEDERRKNPPSRSAKLRVIEKTAFFGKSAGEG
ncbi:MAG: 16S rRNA (cytosine(1402)-N(4))-methyltransferase RsmH [Spirochaetaceae bacterium]|jgi:16S rRNA (cytosine1402-N4)-methyltransferase|nr:16S rRNA (cytosine(1402)-N(4))-methyltransferase RsmH [Spirochaetaceae bacterium]